MVIKELRQRQTEKDKYNLENIKSLLRSMLNPFSCTTDKCVLFNIKTGQQIPRLGESFLLNVIKISEEKGDAFIDECRQNPERFEQSLRRATIHNFTSQNLLKINQNRLNNYSTSEGTRDMFGQLLYFIPFYQS